MRHIRFLAVAALAGASLAACHRNRPDDTATIPPNEPAPQQTDTVAQPQYPTPDPVGRNVDSTMMGGNPQLAMGDSIFTGKIGGANCQSCHGADAKGTDQGPDLTDEKWIHGDGSLEFIKGIVRNGVPQPKEHTAAMPAFGQSLSEEQINAVAAFVRSRGPHGAS